MKKTKKPKKEKTVIQYSQMYGRFDKKTKNFVLELEPPYKILLGNDEISVHHKRDEKPRFLSRRKPIYITANGENVEFRKDFYENGVFDTPEILLESSDDFDEYKYSEIIEF